MWLPDVIVEDTTVPGLLCLSCNKNEINPRESIKWRHRSRQTLKEVLGKNHRHRGLIYTKQLLSKIVLSIFRYTIDHCARYLQKEGTWTLETMLGGLFWSAVLYEYRHRCTNLKINYWSCDHIYTYKQSTDVPWGRGKSVTWGYFFVFRFSLACLLFRENWSENWKGIPKSWWLFNYLLACHQMSKIVYPSFTISWPLGTSSKLLL